MTDLRYAARMLCKNPLFSGTIVAILAIGIGASTAIYSVVNTVLLNPVPGPAPERLIQIAERNYNTRDGKPFFVGVAPPVFEAVRQNQDFFADLIWIDGIQLERKTADFVEIMFGVSVSPNFFTFWNERPLLGRTFAKEDAVRLVEHRVPEKDSVIVVSYTMWKSLFAGDPEVIGKTVEMSGRTFTVIGVMPAHFQVPAHPQFWLATEDPRLPPGWMSGPNIHVLVRLKPGSTEQQTQAMLDTVAARLMKDSEQDSRGYGREWRRRQGGFGFWIRPMQ